MVAEVRFRHLYTIIVAALMLSACDYDEILDTCAVEVQLVYPEDSVDPYAGARVELKDANASIFVDSTDVNGRARFNVPPGIYEASSMSSRNDTTGDTWWHYNFNGVRSMIIISPDSTNRILLDLKMSKKRIVH